jgi:DNA-binding transcriptional ArsR family regulator
MSRNITTLLKLVADGSSLRILNCVAKSYEAGEVNGISVPISRTSLTRRQYYRRLSVLTKMGLIARNNQGKYTITLFGRLVSGQLVIVEKLIDHYWTIQAIESIKSATASEEESDHQFIGLINTLIKDHNVRGLLFSAYSLEPEQNDTIAAKKGY